MIGLVNNANLYSLLATFLWLLQSCWKGTRRSLETLSQVLIWVRYVREEAGNADRGWQRSKPGRF